MPNQPKTQHRSIRIPDDLWAAAKAKAQAEGTTVSEEVNRYLKRYVARAAKPGKTVGPAPAN